MQQTSASSRVRKQQHSRAVSGRRVVVVPCRATLTVPQQQRQQERTLQNAVALKEWAVGIEALSRGEQTVLLRKGGIKEPVFQPPQSSFLLFPTSFHSDTACLKPGVAERYSQALALEPKQEKQLDIGVWAQVTGAWVTEDGAVLRALDDLHIWTQGFVDARLKWRHKQPLTLLELRAWRVTPALQLRVHEELFGCFSFVDLAKGLPAPHTGAAGAAGQQLTLAGLTPVLTDDEFAARQARLRERLAGVSAQPLQLPA